MIGLAQLNHFRGSVGRGEHQSYCFLLTTEESQNELDRLKALVESDDGFVLAEKDLELRGPGEIYGRLQSGLPKLKIANLLDYDLIKKARACAEQVLDEATGESPLAKRVEQFISEVHLE